MGWVKFVMQQVLDKGRIYIEESTIDLWVLQHGWDFPVRYTAVAGSCGMISVATITPKTAWRLLRLARHPDTLAAEEAFDYGKGIGATIETLVGQLEDLGYDARSDQFKRATEWAVAKRAKFTSPPPSGGR